MLSELLESRWIHRIENICERIIDDEMRPKSPLVSSLFRPNYFWLLTQTLRKIPEKVFWSHICTDRTEKTNKLVYYWLIANRGCLPPPAPPPLQMVFAKPIEDALPSNGFWPGGPSLRLPLYWCDTIRKDTLGRAHWSLSFFPSRRPPLDYYIGFAFIRVFLAEDIRG